MVVQSLTTVENINFSLSQHLHFVVQDVIPAFTLTLGLVRVFNLFHCYYGSDVVGLQLVVF